MLVRGDNDMTTLTNPIAVRTAQIFALNTRVVLVAEGSELRGVLVYDAADRLIAEGRGTDTVPEQLRDQARGALHWIEIDGADSPWDDAALDRATHAAHECARLHALEAEGLNEMPATWAGDILQADLDRAADEVGRPLLAHEAAHFSDCFRSRFAEIMRDLIEAASSSALTEAIDISLGVAVRTTGAYPPNSCSVCNQQNVSVCCTFATYDDGTHDDPVCRNCCGPHHPQPRDREYFPQG